MSTEKTIKNQAKKSLTGNWTLIIAGVLFALSILVLVNGIEGVVGFAMKLIDTDTGNAIAGRESLYTVVECCASVLLVAALPLLNGLYKMFYNTAVYGKTELSDLFCCFKGFGKYIKTIAFDIVLAVVYGAFAYGLDFYAYASMFSGKSLDSAGFNGATVILAVAFAVSIIIKIIAYFLFVHYSLFAYAADDSAKLTKCSFGMYGFAFRHLGSTIKLLFGFIGWIALCFFVVPAFYVLPYIMTSFAMSAKWLFALEKDRGLLC